ncbi:hypothetical protein [Oceanisphaera avium]|uniref:Uncharacterized protein n=1 Tax=Oceanisphaera avium TaxID=1903694 RepID=A0A1Y0CZR3_9GAMM|nr:hypothetical protein [Oceanisphaera avium]ART80356.1 hypothetical protein CBP12_09525 [Oceanisphaera avium]
MTHFVRGVAISLCISFALSACSTPPLTPAPVKAATVKTPQPVAPKPYENGVISVPTSPVQTLPSDW